MEVVEDVESSPHNTVMFLVEKTRTFRNCMS